ncbi:MAG: hypothetical protein QOF52_699 [Propionibacteriaceae bacterium]|jgi:hypothetical protein|nr:hypothetical protein [Propionibacteriaceae bacterium]MDX6320841.1 hypothetical protein [Propionibacteriaceae bacterium]
MINSVHSQNLAVNHFAEIVSREQAARQNLARWRQGSSLNRRSGPSVQGEKHDGADHA